MNDGFPRQTHVFMKHKDGHRVPVHVRVKPLRDGNGSIVGCVETFSDDSFQTTLKNRFGELERLALIDELTGIGNRRFADITLTTTFNELETL